ncbi:T9SS type A sorting domain-containing protein [Dyadobacter flavalbus]|uniref:T9SS type A sorting domain-containing protein n=1 Tax=Dyadobacter flavalbus TaxID=2579942 RepID=A0A5M8QWU5_9BACT|nr:M4 family metallopeptidase [Dyadobacter flavalbus]KAA6439821.1 T9SS type A sorting domain-containing protein [Dyadobacter flavalbus]
MKHPIFTFLFPLFAAAAMCQPLQKENLKMFAAGSGAMATLDPATNSPGMLRFAAGKGFRLSGATAKEKAFAFLKQNPGVFAIRQDKDAYLLKKDETDGYGLKHVTLQQYFQGIPVFDGALKFHFNGNAELASVNGNFIRIDKLNTIPKISQEDASKEAIRIVTGQKKIRPEKPLEVFKSTLMIFQKGLLQGKPGRKHLVYETEVRNHADIREFVYIDAHSGAKVEQYTGIHRLHRAVYDGSVYESNLIWQEGDKFPGKLNEHQQYQLEITRQMYNMMKNAFDYTSYDNKDGVMNIVNTEEIEGYQAYWNGESVILYPFSASDDIVGHEWAHGYIESTSGLVASGQSGNINESFSDIWGETLDQINNYMDEKEDNAIRTGCKSSTRWMVGERTTMFHYLHDMWDPNCTGDPGKISDQEYLCFTATEFQDYVNSGIVNHAYALLVDGGYYNGQAIKGIGLTKAAHIFWQTQANYLTQTTTFAELADDLEAAANDLVGQNLKKLSTANSASGLSGEIIQPSDVAELLKVIAAVELRGPVNCPYPIPLFSPVSAMCVGGSAENALFYEDFESGMDGWIAANTSESTDWVPNNWINESKPPLNRTGHVAYGTSLTDECGAYGTITLTSPVIDIPAQKQGPYYMAFDHYFKVSRYDDGCNLRYRINGGAWLLIPASAFTDNPYNVPEYETYFSDEHPLYGEPAFIGNNIGDQNNTWGQSRINLTALGLDAGDNIQIQWVLGTNGCGWTNAWYIDDVNIYSCAVPTVQFAAESLTVRENDAVAGNASDTFPCLDYVEKKITLKINEAPTAPVTVKLIPVSGNAAIGSNADFTTGSLDFTLQPGKLSHDVSLRVYNDPNTEEDETFKFRFTATGGGALYENFNQELTLTILDDDFAPDETPKELPSADFNNEEIPLGWKIIDGPRIPFTWYVAEGNPLDSAGVPHLFIYGMFEDIGGIFLPEEQPVKTSFESATFDAVGYKDLLVSFIQEYKHSARAKAKVDVWDGETWQNLLTHTKDLGTSENPATIHIPIPESYANHNMKVRFTYENKDWAYWGIDNIKITGTRKLPEIASAVTPEPPSAYLGPHATVYFHDPATGDLMAKIKNLSDHDYGCTTVRIDREGSDETDWFGDYHITNKTYSVVPAHNNLYGSFEITLYYGARELPAFNGSRIKSMGKSQGGISPGNTAATSQAELVTVTAYGSGNAFTSTFHTGFSGFGLSDAPVGPLPVTLSRFEGRHTAEGNLLSWTTATERSNAYFEVERSLNGKDFMMLGRVEGRGNAEAESKYRFMDSSYPAGISYYRLRQVDTDGKSALSRIISIDALTARDLNFYPNPVQSQLTLEVPDKAVQTVDIKIINSSGQVVLTKVNAGKKNNGFGIDLSQLPAGIYQVVMTGKSGLSESRTYNLSILKL